MDNEIYIINYKRTPIGNFLSNLSDLTAVELASHLISDLCNNINNLASKVNILTLHLHLSKDVENLITTKTIELMKSPSYIINTSRGELLKENDIINAIKKNKLDGCALDVVKNEFKPKFRENPNSNMLFKFSHKKNNLIITPKLGGSVIEAWIKTENYLIQQIIKESM